MSASKERGERVKDAPMKMGVFAGTLDTSYVGGLTTYTLGIIQGLAEERKDRRLLVFAPEVVETFLRENLRSADDIEFRRVELPTLRLMEGISLMPGLGRLFAPIRNLVWRKVAHSISTQCDIIYFPGCYLEIPNINLPSVVSFHDLQHEFLPENFSWLRRRMRRLRFGETFRRARVIQASSNSMKADALQIYRDFVFADRIAVIPEGVDITSYSEPVKVDARGKYALPLEYIFYPAQLWPHKNHLRLLKALKLLAEEGLFIPFVLTGGGFQAAGPIFDFVKQNGMESHVFYLGKVPFEDLRGIYKSASYVVTATLYESSSLPLIEGAAIGVPLLASATPPNREASNWFELRLFDPLSVADIARVLKEAWLHRAGNDAAIAANRLAAEKFDWRAIGRQYIDVFETLLG